MGRIRENAGCDLWFVNRGLFKCRVGIIGQQVLADMRCAGDFGNGHRCIAAKHAAIAENRIGGIALQQMRTDMLDAPRKRAAGIGGCTAGHHDRA